MRTDTFKGNTIEIYNDINMPIDRYMCYSKYVLIDSGIGSNLESFDANIAKVMRYMADGKTKEANIVLMNLRQLYNFILNETNPAYLSFAALVKSINGKPCNDLTDEGLQLVVDKLARKNWSVSGIMNTLKDVKKKYKVRSKFTSLRKAQELEKKSSTPS